ncbi:EamA family transporter [Halocatena halophila]|uniref:EamA family transporter n=1 Tax=Halocatena halophila TaxID=2814576 RepID=UPI0038B3E56F
MQKLSLGGLIIWLLQRWEVSLKRAGFTHRNGHAILSRKYTEGGDTHLDRIGPVQINLIGYVAPIFAAINGWILLHERITETVLLGFLAIIVGFSVVKFGELREEIRPTE